MIKKWHFIQKQPFDFSGKFSLFVFFLFFMKLFQPAFSQDYDPQVLSQIESPVDILYKSLLSQKESSENRPFPIQFSIPETKIVQEIPQKKRDFAHIIPGQLKTYIYKTESAYYQGYQESYYAITCKKSGWDCLRHYEILANGCIPYFLDLDKCDSNTMHFLPKELIKEAMNLKGVSYMHIDHNEFDKCRYYEILEKLLEHTRKYLTTKNMAKYVLETINYEGKGNILFLSQNPSPDYMRCLLLTGLKELFQEKVVDFPKIEHIYKSYQGDLTRMHGKGISYTKNVDDFPVNRDNIKERIKNKEFDLIIYGSIHRGTPFLDLVKQIYDSKDIIYICGEDLHKCAYTHLPNFFLREFEEVIWHK